MSRPLTHFYAAAVCFAAAICIAIAAGIALYSVVQITLPQATASNYGHYPGMSPVFMGSQSGIAVAGRLHNQDPSLMPTPPTEEQIAKAREQAKKSALERERSEGIRGLVRWGIVLCVSLTLWSFHWRLMRSKEMDATPG